MPKIDLLEKKNMDVKKYIEMPKEDKWWQKDSNIPEELNDVPIIENFTEDVKNSEFIELQNEIDKLVYDFLKKHDIKNGFSFGYGLTNIPDFKEFGLECPFVDGWMCIYDSDRKSIITSM